MEKSTGNFIPKKADALIQRMFLCIVFTSCIENSDVDIAVFGDISKSAMYKRKSYNRFLDNIYSYDLKQDYDVLYFTNENKKIFPYYQK